MIGLKKLTHKATDILLALFIISAPLFAPISAITPKAVAAPNCTIDVQGANDEPNQKDLTQMCVDALASPAVSWQWDDTAWSGNNTGDACALFDNDNNGLTDYAV